MPGTIKVCLTPAWPHSAGEGCTCPESARLAVQVGCAAGQRAVAGRAGKAEQVSRPGAGQAEAARDDPAARISLQVSLRRIDRGRAGQDFTLHKGRCKQIWHTGVHTLICAVCACVV